MLVHAVPRPWAGLEASARAGGFRLLRAPATSRHHRPGERVPAPFDVAFMQYALVELLLLAGLSAVLGPWIVLRRLAFFTHASGTVSFPGLVLAGIWSVPAVAPALACALAYAALVERAARRAGSETATGLLLVAALALGAILVSDVDPGGSGVDRLLFGTLIGLTPGVLAVTAGALLIAGLLHVRFARDWLVRGFDTSAAGSLGSGSVASDRALLVAIAVSVVVALAAVGALLVSVLLVVPAATARMRFDELGPLRLVTAALALGEGVAALWLADRVDVSVGPALAVVAGVVFGAVAVATSVSRQGAVPA